jgi:hypothetical protein
MVVGAGGGSEVEVVVGAGGGGGGGGGGAEDEAAGTGLTQTVVGMTTVWILTGGGVGMAPSVTVT